MFIKICKKKIHRNFVENLKTKKPKVSFNKKGNKMTFQRCY